MVNLQRADLPVSILKRRRIVLDEFLTCGGLRRTSAVLRPDATSPIAAQRGVDDDGLIFEMLVDIARGCTESCLRDSPASRVRIAGRHVAGERAPWEEPDTDRFVRPLCCIDSTIIGVESCAVR